jgi:hypothetical protein
MLNKIPSGASRCILIAGRCLLFLGHRHMDYSVVDNLRTQAYLQNISPANRPVSLAQKTGFRQLVIPFVCGMHRTPGQAALFCPFVLLLRGEARREQQQRRHGGVSALTADASHAAQAPSASRMAKHTPGAKRQQLRVLSWKVGSRRDGMPGVHTYLPDKLRMHGGVATVDCRRPPLQRTATATSAYHSSEAQGGLVVASWPRKGFFSSVAGRGCGWRSVGVTKLKAQILPKSHRPKDDVAFQSRTPLRTRQSPTSPCRHYNYNSQADIFRPLEEPLKCARKQFQGTQKLSPPSNNALKRQLKAVGVGGGQGRLGLRSRSNFNNLSARAYSLQSAKHARGRLARPNLTHLV